MTYIPSYDASAAQDNTVQIQQEANQTDTSKSTFNIFMNNAVGPLQSPTSLQTTSTQSILNEISAFDTQALSGATTISFDGRDLSASAVQDRMKTLFQSPEFQSIANNIGTLPAQDQANIEIAYAALGMGSDNG